jgi:predicted RNA binding protein YcfA (HicA-like mRNA interferase family)
VKFSELKKILRGNGCYLCKEGQKHEKWYSPITGKYFRVGRHNTDDVKKGTLNSILTDAGIDL